ERGPEIEAAACGDLCQRRFSVRGPLDRRLECRQRQRASGAQQSYGAGNKWGRGGGAGEERRCSRANYSRVIILARRRDVAPLIGALGCTPVGPLVQLV